MFKRSWACVVCVMEFHIVQVLEESERVCVCVCVCVCDYHSTRTHTLPKHFFLVEGKGVVSLLSPICSDAMSNHFHVRTPLGRNV